MATTSEARALPFFTDIHGLPLESGSIFIGQPGLDPQAYPQTVSSDVAGSIILQQPIRTTHGRAVSGGAQVHLFCQVPYSIVVLDAQGRTVYASLNENDPIFSALSTSSVQSASSLPDLRARSGSSTNLVWVAGFGMYRFVPSDNTSPETVPFVIVGNDGSRYYLDLHTGNLAFAKLSSVAPAPLTQGLWLGWNDEGNGATRFSNNQGTGTGGFIFRNMAPDGVTQAGRVTFNNLGSIETTGSITTDTADIIAGGNLSSHGGFVSLNAAGTRFLQFDGTNYQLPGGELFVSGAHAYTTNWFNPLILNGIGSTRIFTVFSATVGTTFTAPGGVPGTWLSGGVFNDHDNNGATIGTRIA